MPEERRAIAVHGGAGNRIPDPSSDLPAIDEALAAAIAAADDALEAGLDALDAVEAAVVVLEDAPCFNAGRGSVPTAAGSVEMDAGVMCGRTLRAGAVALASAPRNPVSVARLLLEEEQNVLLAGPVVDDFARERGVPTEPPGYFLGERSAEKAETGARRAGELGTVGAVVSDGRGNVAAATSTGGRRGQRPGRIGDSPLIGAGVYADNRSCAVSCTGGGEEIMRAVLAHGVAAAVRSGTALESACRSAVHGTLSEIGGAGGLIAVDATGDIGICFNTRVMHRAWKLGRREPYVASR